MPGKFNSPRMKLVRKESFPDVFSAKHFVKVTIMENLSKSHPDSMKVELLGLGVALNMQT